MAALKMKKAQRQRVKIKVGMSAPAGGGKTLSALILAYGLLKGEHPEWTDEQIWEKICIIDSENGSAELYVGLKIPGTKKFIGDYNTIPIGPPYNAQKYIDAFEVCAESGMEVAIADSLTHLWNGVGGMLEKQGNAAKKSGNGYTAWREVTPEFNRFVDTMLQTPLHVIATMRSKTEYVHEKNPQTGKTEVKKVGLAPVMRDGMEYEFTLFFNIDTDHEAQASKDRTALFDDMSSKISVDTGLQIAEWLKGGVVKEPEVTPEQVDTNPIEIENFMGQIESLTKALVDSGTDKKLIADAIKKHHVVNGKASPNFKSIKSVEVAQNVIKELEILANSVNE